MNGRQLMDVTEYLSLAQNITEVFKKLRNFQDKSSRINKELLELEQETNKLNALKGSYPKLEQDINTFIETSSYIESPKLLTDSIKKHIEKIFSIENDVEIIAQTQKKLLTLPDRFGRKSLTNRIELFLNSVNHVSLNQLDKLIDDGIPLLKNEIRKLFESFKNELSDVDEIKREAHKLKNRIDAHKKHQDRYNLSMVCTGGMKSIDRIIATPNYNDLRSDSLILQDIENRLNKCENEFANEVEFYRDLSSQIKKESYLIWKEDYDKLTQILDDGINNIYNFSFQTNYVVEIYRDRINEKASEIASVRALYSQKTLNKFQDEFNKIEQRLLSSIELNKLKEAIDIYEKKEKKRLILQYIKWGAILIGILLVTWIVVNYWPISGIIGAIIIVIFVISFFRS